MHISTGSEVSQAPIWINAQAPIPSPVLVVNSARRCQPRVGVFIEDVNLALDVKDVSPNTVVIARLFVSGDVMLDDNQHKYLSAQKWLELYIPRWRPGLVLYCNNEPSGYEDLSQLDSWTEEVLLACGKQEISVCALNFGAGHPQEGRWPELKKTLLALERYHDLHFLGLHEYGVDNMIAPGRVGRFRELLEDCEMLGIKAPRIAITEWGLDHDSNDPLDDGDGWRTRNITEEQYANMLIDSWNSVYAPYPEVVGATVFAWTQNDRWKNWRIDNAPEFMKRIEEFQPMARNWTTMIAKKRTPTSGGFVNVRAQPSGTGSLLGEIKEGDIVQIDGNVASNGYVLVKWGDAEAWAYVNGNLRFDVYTPPEPEPVPIPLPDPNDDLYRNIITEFKNLELSSGNIARYLKEIWDV